MSSILNSISMGELQVQNVPEVTPIKEDSIIDLLQSSEIEFDTCPKLENRLDNFNTGFGENNDLHFEDTCKKHTLKTPLYQENYLEEFKTEEEKAAARRALGLYNKSDVVAMSLLTTKEEIPDIQSLIIAPIKQMHQGDKLFIPVTTFSAVYDQSGITLDRKFKEIQDLIIKQNKEIASINQVSGKVAITTLGDVREFLKGFNNGESLQDTLDSMNQETLRFESTGQMNS